MKPAQEEALFRMKASALDDTQVVTVVDELELAVYFDEHTQDHKAMAAAIAYLLRSKVS